MVSIRRTTNPLEFDEIDGIVIADSAPEPSIKAVGANTAILVAQFQRGPKELTEIVSIGAFHKQFGKSDFSGNIQLKNKKFSSLKLARVIASDAVKSLKAIGGLKLVSLYHGVYADSISIKVEVGTVAGHKITVSDESVDAKVSPEVFDNVTLGNAIEAFSLSELIVAEIDGEDAIAVGDYTLTGGSDGTVADTDYETALLECEGENSGHVVFLDQYSSTRNALLKVYSGAMNDRMVICSHQENDSFSAKTAEVANLRDSEGRIIYAENWILTPINGVMTYTCAASWVASLISLVSPHESIGYTDHAGKMFGAFGVKKEHSTKSYQLFMEAGICSFEFDPDIGILPKSAIVTQIINSEKVTILRRRMTDWLTYSVAKFLKNYKDAPNSDKNANGIASAMQNFVLQNEILEITPKDKEVRGGKAKIIDVHSLNTDESISEGKRFIKYKQRIYSSMRFIVLLAEIGTGVVVTEE